MPHATMPATGFQAFILCGPGESLAPFNANPTDFPKALIPIANRPMVWYPLDWCYRMGITNITLLSPSSAAPALDAALSQNPHLTTLPYPRPNVIAPPALTLTTGTAELFRLPDVQAAITGDFVVLPCDIVCELPGSSLLESWMTMHAGFGSASVGSGVGATTVALGLGGERSGRRGGLGVWYQTRDTVTEGGVGVKKEETDFLATTELPAPIVPPSSASLRSHIKNVALAMPTAVLQDVMEEKKSLPVRHALLRKHGRVKMMTTYRDAHVYFFPYWVKEMMARNEKFDSVSEDVVGWWAKAGWQDGLAEKLGISELFAEERNEQDVDEVDFKKISTTSRSDIRKPMQNGNSTPTFATRVTNPPSSATSTPPLKPTSQRPISIPPIHSYLHPSHPPAVLLRRVDTVPLLLSVSLSLARLPPSNDPSAPASSFSHTHKIHPTTLLPPQITLKADTNLVDANVTLSSKSTIKDCIIGANCSLGAAAETSATDSSTTTELESSPVKPAVSAPKSGNTGVRMNRTLMMEGAVVEAGCKLNGCVLGRRCRIGADSDLTDCYVQEGFAVPPGTVAKGETLAMGMDEEGMLGGDYEDDDEDANLDEEMEDAGDGEGDEEDEDELED